MSEELPEFDMQLFAQNDSFRRKIRESYCGNIVTVEFCCCGFLKKALGCLVDVGCDFIELVGVSGQPVDITIYRPGDTEVIEETAFAITVPLKQICAVELMSQPCPPCPPFPPCSENE